MEGSLWRMGKGGGEEKEAEGKKLDFGEREKRLKKTESRPSACLKNEGDRKRILWWWGGGREVFAFPLFDDKRSPSMTGKRRGGWEHLTKGPEPDQL